MQWGQSKRIMSEVPIMGASGSLRILTEQPSTRNQKARIPKDPGLAIRANSKAPSMSNK
jgi:hypothetical protein